MTKLKELCVYLKIDKEFLDGGERGSMLFHHLAPQGASSSYVFNSGDCRAVQYMEWLVLLRPLLYIVVEVQFYL